MAMRRLKGMIPRLQRDPERRKRVFAEIQKFSDTGVAIEIDNTDNDATASLPRWHLPLHVVEKGNKTRVCHDARASTGNCCLNDFLLGGPNLVNSLAKILLYSRIWKFVLMNDIRSFFHQVRVDPRDVGALVRRREFAGSKNDEFPISRLRLCSFIDRHRLCSKTSRRGNKGRIPSRRL